MGNQFFHDGHFLFIASQVALGLENAIHADNGIHAVFVRQLAVHQHQFVDKLSNGNLFFIGHLTIIGQCVVDGLHDGNRLRIGQITLQLGMEVFQQRQIGFVVSQIAGLFQNGVDVADHSDAVSVGQIFVFTQNLDDIVCQSQLGDFAIQSTAQDILDDLQDLIITDVTCVIQILIDLLSHSNFTILLQNALVLCGGIGLAQDIQLLASGQVIIAQSLINQLAQILQLLVIAFATQSCEHLLIHVGMAVRAGVGILAVVFHNALIVIIEGGGVIRFIQESGSIAHVNEGSVCILQGVSQALQVSAIHQVVDNTANGESFAIHLSSPSINGVEHAQNQQLGLGIDLADLLQQLRIVIVVACVAV